MTRKSRLMSLVTILGAAASLLMAAAPPAGAATGAGGLTILHASDDDLVHHCNVIANDGTDEAVACGDLLTYEGASDYYAYARGELYCQTESGAPATCGFIREVVSLQTGSGETGTYPESCDGNCPAHGRLYDDTRNWDYATDIPSGQCSDNVNSSYQVWGLVWGAVEESEIELPDGHWVTNFDNANDGENQSTGHYFVCP